jgi:hypothetical protein
MKKKKRDVFGKRNIVGAFKGVLPLTVIMVIIKMGFTPARKLKL